MHEQLEALHDYFVDLFCPSELWGLPNFCSTYTGPQHRSGTGGAVAEGAVGAVADAGLDRDKAGEAADAIESRKPHATPPGRHKPLKKIAPRESGCGEAYNSHSQGYDRRPLLLLSTA
ncbi:hypothetical protein HPB52_003003 [Rhipicephalus sanguineus]|uniref:Uncharacterized protein n=1 Tax=Rhipicephalus sanguineus TaxID=34632 RepID=A0A9D4PZE8_RHISA|nr:hypothetical protein HPB52_003003 [Rhipicephalus sanguineus]